MNGCGAAHAQTAMRRHLRAVRPLGTGDANSREGHRPPQGVFAMKRRALLSDPKAWAATGAVTVLAVAAGAAWVMATRNTRWHPLHGKHRPERPTLAAGRGARARRTVATIRPPEAPYPAW